MPEDISPNQRGAHYLSAIGRLKDGVTATQAIADLARIEAQITAQFSSVEGYGVWAQPLLDSMVGEVRRPLLMLLGAVGFVLLIACVNVSNLLLARASGRRTEIAVRSALGAGRIRIVRQLLAESLLLALVGGLCGIVLAAWGVRALDTLLPQDLPRAAGIAVNLPVLLFSAAVAVLTGLFFGVVPSLQASTSDVSTFLREGRRDGGGSSGSRTFRNVLVATEVALAIVLLTGAGLAARSFDRLTRIDLGFNPQNVLSLTVTPSAPRYAEGAALVDLYRRYVDGMATQPGVKAAGAVMMPPLARGGFGGTFSIIGAPESDDLRMAVRAITHGYLEAAEIPVKRGRSFTAADTETAQPVAIISEEAARRYWPGKDPIGQRIRIHVGLRQGSGREGEREIVGVAGDVKLRQISSPASPTVYVPHSQYVADSMTVFIRTAGDPAALAQIAKARLAEIDPSIAVTRLGPATQHVSSAVAQPRFRMVLLGAFAVMALVLAVVGLYGVLAYSVTRRQSEIGLRMALGADRSSVLRLILIQGLIPVFAGIVAGLAIAAVLTRTMRTLLYGVEPIDPITYSVVAVGLGVAAAAACYLPARRATRIDPLSALRTE
jgi:putative ABC transport system permease protein